MSTFEADVRAIFADDPEFLEGISWVQLRIHSQLDPGEGPVIQALRAVRDGFYNDIILDPDRPPPGPRGRQGRPPSSHAVRLYAERLTRLADLLEREEATIARAFPGGEEG